MTVVATCSDCDDEHPVADRPRDVSEHDTCNTTLCPACGAQPYSSAATEGTVKPADERIADMVSDVYGVGSETLANIQQAFATTAGLEGADTEELTDIDGVGQKTAESIVEKSQ